MVTVIELEIPAEQLALSQAFNDISTLEFEFVKTISDETPLMWVSGGERSSIRAALEADPTVEVIEELGESHGNRWLFHLELDDEFKLFKQTVIMNEGSVLDVSGRSDTWSVKLLFYDSEAVSKAHEQFKQYGFQVEICNITPLDDELSKHSALTKTQYETLVAAYEHGFFDVPRELTLGEFAEELGISHQALSERLRRSQAAFMKWALTNQMIPTRVKPQSQ